MLGLLKFKLLLIIYNFIFFPAGRTAFEKMTDLDFVGETYYTIRNLSLYECQGWCREEPECNAASFSFAVNPTSSPPRQETVCLLQNGTQATNPSAQPLRALNQYYMVKMSVRSGEIFRIFFMNIIVYCGLIKKCFNSERLELKCLISIYCKNSYLGHN